MFPVENVNVFYVTSTGVTEANKFLIFTFPKSKTSTSLILVKKPPAQRHRTYSLPASFESESFQSFENREESDDYNNGIVSVSSSDDLLTNAIKSHNNHCHLDRRRSLSANVLTEKLGHHRYHHSSSNTKPFKSSSKKLKKEQNQKKTISMKKNDKLRIAPCKSMAGAGVSLHIDGYQLSYLIEEMKRSASFRTSFVQRWAKKRNVLVPSGGNLVVLIALMNAPSYEVLDLLGNKMVNSNILYRRSLEHALSWLSTLGGAFSALGDLSPAWAEEAGHVSLTQLRIAMKLGDPGIQSRCRLFSAISLLQKGYLKSCRDIVRREYNYAISLPEGADPRLRRMCLGVWAKLQHQWKSATREGGDKSGLMNSTETGLQYILSNTKYRNVYNLEENRKLKVANSETDL